MVEYYLRSAKHRNESYIKVTPDVTVLAAFNVARESHILVRKHYKRVVGKSGCGFAGISFLRSSYP